MKPFRRKPSLTLGKRGNGLFATNVSILVSDAKSHMHIIGVSGSGKSRFLAQLYLSLLSNGLSATLIDPHGDLATLLVKHLIATGTYQDPEAYDKIVYLNLPRGEREGRFLPFNVLKAPLSPHTIASNVMEAFHRSWPALSGGAAPMFDTLVQNSVKALLSAKLPLTSLYRFLTDQDFREEVLAVEDDPDVVSVFHDWYDKLAKRDQMDQAGSTIRRVNLLTFSPVLKYSLGQQANILTFRQLMDQNRSLIVNLSLADGETRRLFGCLLTVAAEQGALSRSELPPEERTSSHHLLIDEFSEFSAQSEQALATMLSQTRKYGLFVVMSHQTWSQASDRLKGALQNVGLEVAFRLGRGDAQHTAFIMGKVEAEAIKHVVSEGEEKSHPLFYSLPEQWEKITQELQDLPPRHFLLKQATGPVVRAKTLDLPDPQVDKATLEAVETEYLRRYFRAQAEIETELSRLRETPEQEYQTRRKL